MMLPVLMLMGTVMQSECLAVEDEKILASHLADRIVAMKQIKEDTVFGFTPKYGVRRVIPGFEIAAFARKYGVAIPVEKEICVIRSSRKLTEEEIMQSLFNVVREIAGTEDVEIKLLDYSRQELPYGEIKFLKSNWNRIEREDAVFWRGVIPTHPSSNVPFWVKARITVLRDVVSAVRDLDAGSYITPDTFSVRKSMLGLMSTFPASGAHEVVGRISMRKISAGDMIFMRNLRSPQEVFTGEVVEVSIRKGMLHLQLEAKAESSGRRGERIILRNPVSGKRFEARVTGVRQAMVEVAR